MTYRLLLSLSFLVLFSACKQQQPAQNKAPNIIPEPVSMEMKSGTFKLDQSTIIRADTSKEGIKNVAQQLKQELDSATGYDLKIHTGSLNKNSNNVIALKIDNDSSCYFNDEAYSLNVSSKKVKLKAPTGAGLFYGVQSLFQLFPPQIYRTDYTLVPQNTSWEIPTLQINDYPRFKYRGMHLDVGRHFFSVNFVKRYIKLMAMNKMNRFHWHLTEDQGWRIQIDKYPKLTSVGAWRDSTLIGHYGSGNYDQERYGGFYTKKEIREVVNYAQKMNVTVIPEIEMPGHASAALTAYPQMGCKENGNYKVMPTWGVFNNVYCPTEKTFNFLKDVLTEVMQLFPSKYIHIGGDEAPKKQWEESKQAQRIIEREGLANEQELQSYFIRRIEKFLNKNNRQIIGWDEILQGGLAPNATVMSWRGMEGGIKAAKQQHDVIMTPTSHVYLDYNQANPKTEPLSIGNFTPLSEVYHFDPVPEELSPKEAKYIKGIQGNVWTEYMKSGDKVEYMAYPRASAIAEIGWSPKNKHNWTDFWRRLQTQFKRFDVLNVNAARHYQDKIPHFDQ